MTEGENGKSHNCVKLFQSCNRRWALQAHHGQNGQLLRQALTCMSHLAIQGLSWACPSHFSPHFTPFHPISHRLTSDETRRFTEAHTDCQDTTRTTTEQGLAQTALLHRPAPPFALSSQLYRLYRTIEDSMSNSLPTIPLEVGNWSVVCCTL